MGNMQNNKRVFQNLLKAIGGTPKVIEYHDENKTSKVDIYIGVDRPDIGLSSYSTIGLSEYSIDLVSEKGEDIRVEFLGICSNDVDEFPNIISTCAFNIINDNYSCGPGIVYPDVVKEYYKDMEMEHIFFTTPFLLENCQDIVIDNKIITWLLAVPISNNEFEFLKVNGSDALEKLFEKNNIDIFNINRESVL